MTFLKRGSLVWCAIVVAIAPAIAGAADVVAYKRYLFPVLVQQPLPGAHGSFWETEAWFSYAGITDALVAPVPVICSFQCAYPFPISPALPPLRLLPEPLQERALLLHVEATTAPFFSFHSRVRDLSRETDSAGTEIPVVPEDQMVSGPLRLLNVPARDRFRDTLRIYALPETADPEVEVRYFRMENSGDTSTHLLRRDRVTLRRRPPTEIEERLGIKGFYPSVAEIANLQALPEIFAAHQDIWIEIVPLTPGLRIWGFVSITNDVTQQVTLVTP
jgi:hypothetical protein